MINAIIYPDDITFTELHNVTIISDGDGHIVVNFSDKDSFVIYPTIYDARMSLAAQRPRYITETKSSGIVRRKVSYTISQARSVMAELQ